MSHDSSVYFKLVCEIHIRKGHQATRKRVSEMAVTFRRTTSLNGQLVSSYVWFSTKGIKIFATSSIGSRNRDLFGQVLCAGNGRLEHIQL